MNRFYRNIVSEIVLLGSYLICNLLSIPIGRLIITQMGGTTKSNVDQSPIFFLIGSFTFIIFTPFVSVFMYFIDKNISIKVSNIPYYLFSGALLGLFYRVLASSIFYGSSSGNLSVIFTPKTDLMASAAFIFTSAITKLFLKQDASINNPNTELFYFVAINLLSIVLLVFVSTLVTMF